MNKIILIERDASIYASWKNLLRKKRVRDLSVEEVVRKYKGFEGEIIELYEIKENDNDLKKEVEELSKLKNLGICFLLFISSNSKIIPPYVELNGVKLGYDVGVCAEEEDEIYSSIFHEILFGIVEELIEFKEMLNDNFLFSYKSIAEKYLKVHNEMSIRGKDVEDYMPMVIYEIWNLE
ncbi:MAG: hypothetical protein ACHQUC_08225 [Chlamydiales bacterium]